MTKYLPILPFFVLTVAQTALAKASCATYLSKIDQISQSLERRIVVNERKAGVRELKIAYAIANVLRTIDPYMGKLKRSRLPLFLRKDTSGHVAYSYHDGIHFNSQEIEDTGLSNSEIKVLAAHEIGHGILDRNISKKVLKLLGPSGTSREYKLDQMLAPYHELFAGLNVLLFSVDPTAEAELFTAVGAPSWAVNFMRWDMRIPMNYKLRPDDARSSGGTEIYEFLRPARSWLWRTYLDGASREQIALVMHAFIPATERHLNLRVSRGELKLQTWRRRTPMLNREFVKIFEEEFQKLEKAGYE